MNFFRLLLLAILVSIIAQAIHETGHMIIYQIYRRGPTWGFIGLVQIWNTEPLDSKNQIMTKAPDGSTGWLRLASSPNSRMEKILEAMAGPLASLISAILGLRIANKDSNIVHKQIGLMLALITSFTMTAYYLRSPFRMIGDEFYIASQLGIPKGMVEVAFGLAFILCFVLGLRPLDSWHIRLNWLSAVVLGSVTTGILLNLADQWVREPVHQNSLLFQPVLGYSPPVLLVYLLTLASIVVWASQAEKVTSLIKAG